MQTVLVNSSCSLHATKSPHVYVWAKELIFIALPDCLPKHSNAPAAQCLHHSQAIIFNTNLKATGTLRLTVSITPPTHYVSFIDAISLLVLEG
jgi:hypothetical protein